MSVIEIEDRLGIRFSNRQEIVIDKGQGSYVWDDRGARYLDFTSGWGVTCLGHGHPVVVDALCAQARKLMQNPNSGFTYSPARARLLERLNPILPGNLNNMFFANSGAEANDAALKLARKLTGKSRVISTRESFHGRTFNTLSVSGGEHNTARYLPRLTTTQFITYGDIRELQQEISHDTAAVIVEPIQGEGGVRIPPSEYLHQVSEICKEYSVLLIVDEVQTGFARTGKYFALEHSVGDVEVDMMTMGKGIAGGFPFAGFAMTEKLAGRIEKGDHGGTYCGNPLGCAVAAEVVSYLQEYRIPERVSEVGFYLIDGLQVLAKRYPSLVKEVRGVGMLTALELIDDSLVVQLTLACQGMGLLVTPTRNAVIRLIPDLLVTKQDIDVALDILKQAMFQVESQVAAAS